MATFVESRKMLRRPNLHLVVLGSTSGAFSPTPLLQHTPRTHCRTTVTQCNFLGDAFENFLKELDSFADDAVGRRLGNGGERDFFR